MKYSYKHLTKHLKFKNYRIESSHSHYEILDVNVVLVVTELL